MIEIKNLSFHYPTCQVLHGVNWNVAQGDFYVILGANGSGKTTLLKLIARLLKAPVETITIAGNFIEHYSVRNLSAQVAYVPQREDIIFDFPLFDAVMMGRNPYSGFWQTTTADDKKIVMDVLTQTCLLPLKNRLLSELSGGELQRALIARAMVQKTKILLLDEPLANLDITHQFEIMDMLQKLNQEQHTTIIMSLHNLFFAQNYATKILLLGEGHVIDSGDCAAVITEDNIRKLYHLNENFAIDKNSGIIKKK